MATYVMSDLHGEYDAFLALLSQIGFSPRDTLYIVGDVIDRGPDGIKLLQYIRGLPNAALLLGNHELMCLQYLSADADEAIRRRWNRNGNFPTLRGLDALTQSERAELAAYLDALPTQCALRVGGRDFLLVHGFPGENRHDRVWNRPKIDEIPPLPPGTTLIVGHTPVCEYVCPGTDEDMYVYSRKLTESGRHFTILHAPGFIDLDCCAGYGMSAARLACLRLDDMAEFYQKLGR